jgi:glutaredoxin-like protein NrdH
MSDITVYTNPNCIQCDQTKKFLERNNLTYSTVDLSEDNAALEMVLGLGFKAAPVVIAGSEKWSGFKLDKLNTLV